MDDVDYCVIPYEDFDPSICAHEGQWDDEHGGTCDCTGCQFFKGVPDED